MNRLITAPASSMSGADFLRAISGPTEAERLAKLEALNLTDADLRAAIKTARGQLLTDLCALLSKRVFSKGIVVAETVDPMRRAA